MVSSGLFAMRSNGELIVLGGSQSGIHDLSVQGIKDQVRKEIPSMLKGVNPSTSLNSARRVGEMALLSEDTGNEKQAFYGYQRVV